MDSTLGGRSHDGDAIKSLNEPKPITQDANSTCAFFGSSVAQDVPQSMGCYSRFWWSESV